MDENNIDYNEPGNIPDRISKNGDVYFKGEKVGNINVKTTGFD